MNDEANPSEITSKSHPYANAISHPSGSSLDSVQHDLCAPDTLGGHRAGQETSSRPLLADKGNRVLCILPDAVHLFAIGLCILAALSGIHQPSINESVYGSGYWDSPLRICAVCMASIHSQQRLVLARIPSDAPQRRAT